MPNGEEVSSGDDEWLYCWVIQIDRKNLNRAEVKDVKIWPKVQIVERVEGG